MVRILLACCSRCGAPAKPAIVQKPIPFGATRRAETERYAERHYGLHTWKLAHPHVIVEHYTATTTFSSAWNTFAATTYPTPSSTSCPARARTS